MSFYPAYIGAATFSQTSNYSIPNDPTVGVVPIQSPVGSLVDDGFMTLDDVNNRFTINSNGVFTAGYLHIRAHALVSIPALSSAQYILQIRDDVPGSPTFVGARGAVQASLGTIARIQASTSALLPLPLTNSFDVSIRQTGSTGALISDLGVSIILIGLQS